MKDFCLWNAPSLQDMRAVELFYTHKNPAAFTALVPLNGPSTNAWGPLLAFVKAAKLPGFPELHAEAEKMDVRGYGAQGPNSVNCLWADFYATGDREPILLMIAALPSWYQLRPRVNVQTIVQGAGHSVSWSLRPHLPRHGRLRAICKEEANAIDQPLQAREELLLALADAARYPAEGEESATPRAITSRDFGPPPDLTWLDAEPSDTWIPKLVERYSSYETIEPAIIAAEAAGHSRDAGLLCTAVRYYALAARHLAAAEQVPVIPSHALGMALFHEALALARAGKPFLAAFDRAIAIFDLRPELIPWLGGSLEARVQRAVWTRDAGDAREALDRVERAASGPFASSLGTLITWARQSLGR